MHVNQYKILWDKFNSSLPKNKVETRFWLFSGMIEDHRKLTTSNVISKNLDVGILGGALAFAVAAIIILIILLLRKKKSNENRNSYEIEIENRL